jgi:uncharacterized protein (DUF2062 family)
MTQFLSNWLENMRASIPTRETLSENAWLKPVASRMLHPQLWRMQRETVARGVAVGTFWAFVIPVGQFVAATAHCAWWRANIPVATAVTMVTNPLTIGFWLWLAYQTGALFLGAPMMGPPQSGADVLSWFAQYGWPTVLGMGIFAVVGAALGYVLVKLAWRLRVSMKRRRRLKAN